MAVSTSVPAPPWTTPTGTQRPVPTWVNRLAHLTALTAVPAGIWRILLGFGFPMGMPEAWLAESHMPGWGTAYVIGLSITSEAAALLTLGLVRGWGEVFPRWMPLIGGRRVPVMFAVGSAGLGAATLIWLWWPLWEWVPALWGAAEPFGVVNGGWALLMAACYLPLLLWGPMLAVVTVAYWLRRSPRQSA